MATSQIEVMNLALIALGESRITSTSQGKRADVMRDLWDSVRDAVLEDHPWNCAIARARLSALTTAPTFGFTKAYQLPSDFIRLVRMRDLASRFRIEGDTLATDLETVEIRYVFRLEEVAKMQPGLQQAIAARLAAEGAVAITGDESKRTTQWAIYRDKLQTAQLRDSQQEPVDTIDTQWSTAARYSDGHYPQHWTPGE